MSAFEYDVALSFAGEERALVEPIAVLLREAGVRVFYDGFEEDNLWGKDLYVHLQDVYSQKARFCVIFASAAYAAKAWPSHERQAAQERALREKGQEYILPVRIDETAIPGVAATVAYVQIGKGAAHIFKLIRAKLSSSSPSSPTPAAPIRAAPTAVQLGAPPFALVDDQRDPTNIAPGLIAAGPFMVTQASPLTGPTREVAVVPYSVPHTQFEKAEALSRIRAAQPQTRRGQPMFPPRPLDEPTGRYSHGLLWQQDAGTKLASRFGIGFDASFMFTEPIAETTRRHPVGGTGVGLFCTLDRVIGAVVFTRRLFSGANFPRSWMILTLYGIEHQPLSFDYDDTRRIGPSAGFVATTESIRIAAHFVPSIADDETESFATQISKELAYYFGWNWSDAAVRGEIRDILANISAQ